MKEFPSSKLVIDSRWILSIMKILAGAILALSVAPRTPAQTTFVRVNQVGYEAGTNSRAYLMSTKKEAQATFNVLDANGKIVFSGAVPASSGAWGKFNVFP